MTCVVRELLLGLQNAAEQDPAVGRFRIRGTEGITLTFEPTAQGVVDVSIEVEEQVNGAS